MAINVQIVRKQGTARDAGAVGADIPSPTARLAELCLPFEGDAKTSAG
jgi:hypothetical protein